MNAREEIYAAARAAHPDIGASPEAYAAFVRERLGEAAPAADVAADLLLACGCAAADERALATFDAVLLSQLPQFLSRLESSPAELDEIRQRLRERLFVGDKPKIVEYRGRGRLASWLRVVAIRTALNLRASRKDHVSDSSATDALAAADDPELEYLRTRYRSHFHEAFTAALDALPPRDRTLLRLQLLDGLNIDAIGHLYSVHRATAARWLEAARERLFVTTRDHLQRELGVSATELASLVRLVRSQIDISVCRILGEKG